MLGFCGLNTRVCLGGIRSLTHQIEILTVYFAPFLCTFTYTYWIYSSFFFFPVLFGLICWSPPPSKPGVLLNIRHLPRLYGHEWKTEPVAGLGARGLSIPSFHRVSADSKLYWYSLWTNVRGLGVKELTMDWHVTSISLLSVIYSLSQEKHKQLIKVMNH